MKGVGNCGYYGDGSLLGIKSRVRGGWKKTARLSFTDRCVAEKVSSWSACALGVPIVLLSSHGDVADSSKHPTTVLRFVTA
ncbi:hypothetical protein KQX54_004710 [Cotesia glomerata]|uniref:Uncharacterized protein n=1 Tax=Cotesia glomerata TaxID=32391 RepID=A0AAV7I2L0_COTGL|nr:hypothetical protein KQX54_004710 [Cotesia glomerata]